MIQSFFDKTTRLSIRFKWATITLAILAIIGGLFALGGLNLELLPSIEFPQTFVIAQWPEAESVDDFLNEVTIPLEDQLSDIEGVVNVESTTTGTIAFIIVRNEFGINQDKLVDELQQIVDNTDYPAGMDTPQVLDFSLSDLPVVVASISSPDLELAELKTAVQEDLQPELESITDISQVSVSGGQELPDEEAMTDEAMTDETADEIIAEPTTEPQPTIEPTPEPTPDPSALPDIFVQGAAAQGLDIQVAQDIDPEFMEALAGFGDIAIQSLGLLTPDNLRLMQPQTIAWLPPAFLDTLSADLVTELDTLSAEFGGAGALALAAMEPAEEPTTEEEDGMADVPDVEPVPLPEAWVAAGEQAGQVFTDTSAITPEVITGIVQFAPDLLLTLEPAHWRAIDPAALVIALPEAINTLDPSLLNQLTAIIASANGQPVTPVLLPEAWVAAGEQGGQVFTDTTSLTPEIVTGIAQFAPDLFLTLDEPTILALDPATQAALPEDYVTSLDEGLQQTLAVIATRNAQYLAANTGEEELSLVDPLPLPAEWIAAGEQVGQVFSHTGQIDAEVMTGLVTIAPELLNTLSPAQWRVLQPNAIEIAIPAVSQPLTPSLLLELDAILIAANGQLPEPVSLPDSWIAAASAVGMEVATTADFDATSLEILSGAAPELLEELTPEQLLGFSADAQAGLPFPYISTLDPGLQQTLLVISQRASEYFFNSMAEVDEEPIEDEEEEEEEAVVEDPVEEEEEVDPARLPEILIEGAASTGQTLEYAQDLTPDLMRLFGGIPQAAQLLGLLTPDNLRLLPTESIALLPPDFVETLDPELRAELDELSAEFGGAGALATAEMQEAEEASADSPPLSGPWIEPPPDGSEPLFKTAADFVNNPFGLTAAELLNFLPDSGNLENPAAWIGALTPDVIAYLADNEEGFVETLNVTIIELMSAETITFLLDTYPEAFDTDTTARLLGIAGGDIEVFIPESTITRTDGDPAMLINVFKAGDANTVVVAHEIFDALDTFIADQAENGVTVNSTLVFEQATFIEESIEGVSREGVLGSIFAIIIILIFLSGQVNGKYKLSWRSTAVTAVSIPLSILMALLFMRWLPPTLGEWMTNWAESSGNGTVSFIARLFPKNITLNIMTLSGLTVAVGRVVDDSIVVLENIYRFIQKGDDPYYAVIEGTKEVAIAIFSSTVTTMAVFLPLGLIGGLIGSFFLPFGLTVTYALAASFIVAITIVPVLAFLLIRKEHLPEEKENWMQRRYTPLLKWALGNRVLTLVLAFLLFFGSLALLGQLPTSFIPGLGEPTINLTIELPAGTDIITTNQQVAAFEETLKELDGIETIQSEVGGGGGQEALFGGGGGSVTQNLANMTISAENQEELANLTNEIRAEATAAFGEDSVTVSAAAQTGFSGFSIILTGESLDQLKQVSEEVKATLGSVDVDGDGLPDITNVTSNVDQAALGGDETIIRIDGRPAISFGGELETENTLGVTSAAKEAIGNLSSLPAGTEVTEGFDSEQQVEGFQGMITAIGYSIILVYLVMALTFRSFIHPFTILFSLPFALVGASVALFLTDSVLGISAMIGLLMLVGVVVTNAIVLMELVQQLREKGQNAYDALVEAGRTRLRPIWMTALTAVLALIPLATSAESGAIIASELARAVIGGLIVSTALTLLVVPVVYSLFDQIINRFRKK